LLIPPKVPNWITTFWLRSKTLKIIIVIIIATDDEPNGCCLPTMQGAAARRVRNHFYLLSIQLSH